MVVPVSPPQTESQPPEPEPAEPFIPLTFRDLLDAFCVPASEEPGRPAAFREVCRLLELRFRLEYDELLERLEGTYGPFDPDRDTVMLRSETARQRDDKLNHLFSELSWLMGRAHFRHLSRDEIEPDFGRASHWGLDMDVDFRLFERLAIFVRGECDQTRTRRHRWRLWKRVDVDVPVYRRVVMLLKFRPHPRLGSKVDPEKVYLQLFKDIPKLDLKMLLPGARVRLNRVDRSKMGFSLITGLGLTLWHILEQLAGNIVDILFSPHPWAAWGLATGTLGYGVRSYYGYQQTRQRYALSLTQLLYFQNLDTNAGVLYRVIREAQEQECRQATLAYHVLRHNAADGVKAEDVSKIGIEQLRQRTGLRVSFRARSALENLLRTGIASFREGRFFPVPDQRVKDALYTAWKQRTTERSTEKTP